MTGSLSVITNERGGVIDDTLALSYASLELLSVGLRVWGFRGLGFRGSSLVLARFDSHAPRPSNSA